MGNMSLEKQLIDGQVVIAIAGNIDEDSNFSNHKLNDDKEIILDLEHVTSINSCGIREWINWLKDASNTKLVFKKCPKVIIDQINMVSGFLPEKARVESFYVPYYSEDTGEEKLVLFTHGKEFTDNSVNAPETITDNESGDELEIDVVETKYFRFLNK